MKLFRRQDGRLGDKDELTADTLPPCGGLNWDDDPATEGGPNRDGGPTTGGSGAWNSGPAPDDEPPLPKEMGRAAVTGVLGRGGSGSVYRVCQTREYAVKVIPWNGGSRENARREFETARDLEGAGRTIRYFDYYERDGASYLVQELSSPWFDWYERHPCRVADVLFGVLDVLRTLEGFAALGYAHCDVKPGNLFVGEDGVRIGDFSHTVRLRPGDPCRGPLGSLPYMAPEARDAWTFSGTEDLYSLGVTMYVLLTGGKMPFGEQRAPGDRIDTLFLNEGLVRIVEKAAAYDPADRYRTAGEFAEAVRGFISSHLGMIMEEIPAYGRRESGTGARATETTETNWPRYYADRDYTTCALPSQLSAASRRRPVDVNEDGRSFGAPAGQNASQAAPGSAEEDVERGPVMSQVKFTAAAESGASPGDMRVLEIAMYTEAWEQAVMRELRKELGPRARSYTSHEVSVPDGARVTVRLSAPGLVIEPGSMTLRWNKKYLKFPFSYEVPEEYGKNRILFSAKVFINGVMATTLTLSVPIVPGRIIAEMTRNDVTSAFLSYARRDMGIVSFIAQTIKAARRDIRLFVDLEKLHGGEKWQERLDEELEKSDLLYLCWSRNAAASEWVEYEWKYMAENKGVDSILPIALEGPDLCPVPEMLNSLQFDDVEVLIRSARRFADRAGGDGPAVPD